MFLTDGQGESAKMPKFDPPLAGTGPCKIPVFLHTAKRLRHNSARVRQNSIPPVRVAKTLYLVSEARWHAQFLSDTKCQIEIGRSGKQGTESLETDCQLPWLFAVGSLSCDSASSLGESNCNLLMQNGLHCAATHTHKLRSSVREFHFGQVWPKWN